MRRGPTLCLVKSEIRVLEHIFGAGAFAAARADAGPRVDQVAVMLDRLAEAVEEVGRERLDFGRSAHARQQQPEFIATEPRDAIVRSGREP